MPLHVSSTVVLIIRRSKLYYTESGNCHTGKSEWYKIRKIQFYKYEHVVVKFMYEFFECDYCVLLTVNMLCHVQVTFIQLLNLLKGYYVYLHLRLPSLSSHKIV